MLKTLIIIAVLALATAPALATDCQERPTPTTQTHVKNAKLEQPHRPTAKPQHRNGHLIPATRWTPSVWVGTGWQAGACPV
jgi:hypothetical protein